MRDRVGWRLAVFMLACALAAAACAGADSGPEVPVLRVAGGPDEETQLLAHVVATLVATETLEAEVVRFADSRDARQALELAEVDLGIGYTGEAWLEVLGRSDPPSDPAVGWRAVRDAEVERGLTWLTPRFGEGIDEAPANATFAFVVQGPPGIDADVTTMSQLASRLAARPDAPVCVDREFAERPDGLAAVLLAYSVRGDRPFLAADPNEAVAGVVAGECLAGLTTATDGGAWRNGLRPLVDDLRVFPAFVPVPVVRTEILAAYPEIRANLRPLTDQLSTAVLGQMNAQIRAGRPIATVAQEAAAELRRRADATTFEE